MIGKRPYSFKKGEKNFPLYMEECLKSVQNKPSILYQQQDSLTLYLIESLFLCRTWPLKSLWEMKHLVILRKWFIFQNIFKTIINRHIGLTLIKLETSVYTFCKQCRTRSEGSYRSLLIRGYTGCHIFIFSQENPLYVKRNWLKF